MPRRVHRKGPPRRPPPRLGRKPPRPKAERCHARVKSCKKCGHRFPKGDKTWNCPECGAERRCGRWAIHGTSFCARHGGKSDLVKEGVKFRVAHQIQAAYNNLIGSPDLLNLGFEIAAVTARTDELMAMLDKYDARAAAPQITSAAEELADILAVGLSHQKGKRNISVSAEAFKAAVHRLRRAIEPANIERRLWEQLGENLELTRRLNDTERKWLLSNEGMVPVVLVLEVMIALQRVTLKYVKAPEDRQAFASEFRNAMPIDVTARRIGEGKTL